MWSDIIGSVGLGLGGVTCRRISVIVNKAVFSSIRDILLKGGQTNPPRALAY